MGRQLVTGGCEDGGEVGPPCCACRLSFPHGAHGAGWRAVAAAVRILSLGREGRTQSPWADSRALRREGLCDALQLLPGSPVPLAPRDCPGSTVLAHCLTARIT